MLISILLPATYSVSLGSFIEKDSDSIKAGDSTSFEVLFWNSGEDSYTIKISKNTVPDGWGVSIEPNNFLLEKIKPAEPPFDGGKYINLPGVGVIKPSHIKIRIDAPGGAKPGNYDLSFRARTYNHGNEISTSQETDINFRLKVIGNSEKTLSSNLASIGSSGQPNKESKNKTQTNETSLQEININNNSSLSLQNESNKDLNPLTGKVISGTPWFLTNPILIIILSFVGILLVSLVIYKYA